MITSKMRKRKPTRQICGYTVPNPPRTATHVALDTEDGKKAVVRIEDFNTLEGSAGTIFYVRKDHKGRVTEEFPNKYIWTGKEVLFQ